MLWMLLAGVLVVSVGATWFGVFAEDQRLRFEREMRIAASVDEAQVRWRNEVAFRREALAGSIQQPTGEAPALLIYDDPVKP